MPRNRKMPKSFEQMLSEAEGLPNMRGTSRMSSPSGQKRYRKEDDIESEPMKKKQKTNDHISNDTGAKDSSSRQYSLSKRTKSLQSIPKDSPSRQYSLSKRAKSLDSSPTDSTLRLIFSLKKTKSPVFSQKDSPRKILEGQVERPSPNQSPVSQNDEDIGQIDEESQDRPTSECAEKSNIDNDCTDPKRIVHNPESLPEKAPANFQCLECEKTFGLNKDKYKLHKNLDHHFKCTRCHLKFTLRSKLDDHESEEHPWEVMFDILDRQVKTKKMRSLPSPEPQTVNNEVPRVKRNDHDNTSTSEDKTHTETDNIEIGEKTEETVTSPSAVNISRNTGA